MEGGCFVRCNLIVGKEKIGWKLVFFYLIKVKVKKIIKIEYVFMIRDRLLIFVFFKCFYNYDFRFFYFIKCFYWLYNE